MQEASVFVFDKKLAERLYKPKRREQLLERIRIGIDNLKRKPSITKTLAVMHGAEESNGSLIFATEPILASLANILAWHVSITTTFINNKIKITISVIIILKD